MLPKGSPGAGEHRDARPGHPKDVSAEAVPLLSLERCGKYSQSRQGRRSGEGLHVPWPRDQGELTVDAVVSVQRMRGNLGRGEISKEEGTSHAF